MKSVFKTNITFFPFIKGIKEYQRSYLKDDLIAGFSVALLAIPQSIAYALLAGLPPSAGLFSAIFGAIFTAAFGSSRHLVAGPSTGIAILLQTAISDTLFTYYPAISLADKQMLSLQILAHIVLVVGVVQILAGLMNLGKILQFVSRSVIFGYFAGIVIAIIVNQLFYFLGIEPMESAPVVLTKAGYLIAHLKHIQWDVFVVGAMSVVLLLVFNKWLKRFPNSFLMLLFVVPFVYFFSHYGLSVPVLKDIGFSEGMKIQFTTPFLNLRLMNQIFTSAIAIAFLSVLEVFSVARSLCAKTGQKMRANQETYGIGISNLILSVIFGAMPASGSAARSWMNFQNHSKSRFSALLNGIFVALLVLFAWPLIKYIPLAALAAILLVLVPRLIDSKSILLCFKATKGDAIVFLLTMGSCLVFSLDIAFYIGIFISIAFFLKRASQPYVVEYAFNDAGRLQAIDSKMHIHRNVRILGIGGELFFAAVDFLQDAVLTVAQDPYVKAIVLKLNSIYHVDASMCLALIHMHNHLKAKNKQLFISGLTWEVWQVLQKSGVIEILGQDNLFLTDETKPQFSTWQACIRAKETMHNQ